MQENPNSHFSWCKMFCQWVKKQRRLPRCSDQIWDRSNYKGHFRVQAASLLDYSYSRSIQFDDEVFFFTCTLLLLNTYCATVWLHKFKNKHTAYATQFLIIHLPLTLLAANGDQICTEKDFAPVFNIYRTLINNTVYSVWWHSTNLQL